MRGPSQNACNCDARHGPAISAESSTDFYNLGGVATKPAYSAMDVAGTRSLRLSRQFESVDNFGKPEPHAAHFHEDDLRLGILRHSGEFRTNGRMLPVRLGLRLHCPSPVLRVSTKQPNPFDRSEFRELGPFDG